jgi:hypothetical protein
MPKSIQALINTWAKVESSQPLSQAQNQQVLSQLAQLSGQSLATLTSKQGAGISEKLNLSNLAQSLSKESSLSDTLKLVLVKLISVKGPINILSERPLKPDTQVLLTQTPQGKLTLQTPQNTSLLNQFRTQFITQNFNPTPIPLVDSHQTSGKQHGIGQHFIPPPVTTLKSDIPLAPNTLKQALINSGQNLESKLASILNTQAPKTPATPVQQSNPQPANTQPASNTDSPKNMSGKIAQVEQNIQKWVSLFQQKLTNQSHPPIQNNGSATETLTQQSLSKHPAMLAPGNTPTSTQLLNSTQNTANTTHSSVAHDHKNWLIQSQHKLLDALSTQLLRRKDSFIPNWPAMSSQGQNPGTSIKTFQDVSQWLELLMMPKHAGNLQGEALWPKALGVQPQLQQTLTALLSSFMQTDDDAGEAALLRQLLNINQSLSKLTHDQIQNRLWQGQSDTTQFQLSLPYIQQNQIQWCEFECKQQEENQQNKEKTTGWHLILRFAQNSEQAFAIESHLKQEQLALTLWANQAQQLKHLHQNMPLIKRKLEQAGFKIDSITSKHGIPKPLHQPIQQSLIDVHT